jgi:uncharacterized protein YecE (DUF72 family)
MVERQGGWCNGSSPARDGWAYTDAQLAAWAERITSYRAQGRTVYAYFNNDPHGHAITDGKRLRALLAG